MELVKKLEGTLAGWYKQVPFHLPAGGRKWLASNVWWLVLIGVVLGILSVFASVQAAFWAQQVTNTYSAAIAYYGIAPTANTSLNMTSLWVSILFFAAIVVLELMAISPLKAQKKRGWNLLFLTMLLSATSSVVSAVLQMSPMGLIGAAIGLAIGGYFLFEIHESFNGARAAKKTEAPKSTK